jgi:alpha,alpha-trehalase
MVGNGACEQLQLDGLANVPLAAKLIYNQHRTREHWDVVVEIADYVAANWQETDHGTREEETRQQYTTSKVVASVALRFIAEHSDDPSQAVRWRRAEQEIRRFVARECLTADGAYAVAAWPFKAIAQRDGAAGH